MAKKQNKPPEIASKEAEQKAAATQAALIANFRLKPGDRFTYGIFCRYVKEAGILPDYTIFIFNTLVRDGKIVECDGLGLANEIKYYEAQSGPEKSTT